MLKNQCIQFSAIRICGGGHTKKMLYVGIWRVFDVQVSFSNEGRDLGE